MWLWNSSLIFFHPKDNTRIDLNYVCDQLWCLITTQNKRWKVLWLFQYLMVCVHKRPETPFWTLVLALREGGLLVGTNLSRGRGSKEEFEKVFFGWNIVEIISILDTFAFPLRIYSNGISSLEALNLWKLLFSKSATWREGENVAWLCWTGWLTHRITVKKMQTWYLLKPSRLKTERLKKVPLNSDFSGICVSPQFFIFCVLFCFGSSWMGIHFFPKVFPLLWNYSEVINWSC